jgi:hypothetical protein
LLKEKERKEREAEILTFFLNPFTTLFLFEFPYFMNSTVCVFHESSEMDMPLIIIGIQKSVVMETVIENFLLILGNITEISIVSFYCS